MSDGCGEDFSWRAFASDGTSPSGSQQFGGSILAENRWLQSDKPTGGRGQADWGRTL